uniref:Uncharacterized protein n=1 Tax=Arion vulgaris TaxID=1028688 RepID=A0A0B7BED0_9EUPU
MLYLANRSSIKPAMPNSKKAENDERKRALELGPEDLIELACDLYTPELIELACVLFG